MVNTTAAILAGGLGSRLRPAVADRPKVLAAVRGRPFLAYLLEQLLTAGIRQAVLCTGYLGEQVRAAFGDTYHGLQLAYSQEASPLGTAGALRLALPLLQSDPVLVMNGDSLCRADLNAFWTWARGRHAAAVLLVTRVADAGRYGRVQVAADGAVVGFEEKDGQRRPGWINAGIYRLPRATLQGVPGGQPVSLERELLPAWIGRGVYGYQTEEPFLDIGTPESYAKAEQFFARAFRA